MMHKIIIDVDTDLADLVPNFLANRKKDLAQIAAALEQQDMEALRIIGHNMKGVGGGYGFNGITEFGKNIETAAKIHDLSDIAKQLQEYQYYLDHLEVHYV